MRPKVGDDEEQYFRELEIEQRQALRRRLEKAATDLANKKAVAHAAGTPDLELADQIRALGFDGDRARIFDLMPLVHVAWADDSVSRAERANILKILRARGIEPETEAFRMMESLLEERPSRSFLDQSLALLRRVLGGTSARAGDLVDLTLRVAEASGGFLGMGSKVSSEEKAAIQSLADALGPSAVERARALLDA